MISALDRIGGKLSRWFGWIGGIALLGMTALACINMILRPMGTPLAGAYELIGFLGAMVVAFSLGHSQVNKAHISVDILATRYSEGTKRLIDAINSLLCTIFFLLVSWKTAHYATDIWRRGETSETLRMIYHPFVYAVSLCCLLLAFLLLVNFMKALLAKGGEKA
ncbi:MAG: TRAP transporter small permease subunit [Thermodesulfobacteriota bacterium]